MKVLQVVQHLKTGGLEKVVISLTQHSRYSRSMYLLSLEGTKQDAINTFPELEAVADRIICLNKQPGIQWNVSHQLSKIIKHYEIDIVHSHHIGPLLYCALASVTRAKYQHLHTLHDAWFLQQRWYRLMFKCIAFSTNTRFIADANSVRRDVAKLTGVSPQHTILNGINTEQFKPGGSYYARHQLGLPQGLFLIGCAARLEPGKGHDSMLHALTQLPNNMAMVFAGDGSLRDGLVDLSQSLNISHRVFWLGNCQQMPLFYQAIDSFCLFSAKEGLPLTLLEAMASRKPLVATRVGGIPEIVDKKTSILLSPNNYRALPQALLRSLQKQPSQGHTLQLRRKIDISTMCQKYDDLFERLAY